MSSGEDDGFLQRWARRKAQVRRGPAEPEPVAPAVAPQPAVTPPRAVPVSGAAPAAAMLDRRRRRRTGAAAEARRRCRRWTTWPA